LSADWVANVRIISIHADLVKDWTKDLTTEERSALARLRHYCLLGIIGEQSGSVSQTFSHAIGQAPDFFVCEKHSQPDTLINQQLSGAKHLMVVAADSTVAAKRRFSDAKIAGYCGPTFLPSAEAQNADLTISDWTQLEFGLARANTPIRYVVRAVTIHAKVTREFTKWMRVEHGDDLLKQCGCEEFRVFHHSETEITCEYLFRSDIDLQRYLREHAPKLRERGLEMFPEHLVTFSRSTSELKIEGYRRGEQDILEKSYSGVVP
jgi:hypothetical protein